jgi:hypothetical protein
VLGIVFVHARVYRGEVVTFRARLTQNEAKLIAALADTKQQLTLAQSKFSALRTQAQQKLTNASEQIDRLKCACDESFARRVRRDA